MGAAVLGAPPVKAKAILDASIILGFSGLSIIVWGLGFGVWGLGFGV